MFCNYDIGSLQLITIPRGGYKQRKNSAGEREGEGGGGTTIYKCIKTIHIQWNLIITRSLGP